MVRLAAVAFALFLFTTVARAQGYTAPEPYGGKQAVAWMLEQEQHFPPAALAAGVEGDVSVAFQVRADGSANNVRVTLPLDPACDREAVRLVKLIRWKPASVGGTALDHDHSIDIPFRAKRYKKQHAKEAPCAAPELHLPADSSFALYSGKEVDTLAVPRIPGGLRALPQFLATNLHYPPEAFRLDIQGQVSIEFVVETSGTISNLRTLNFLGGGCDTEAMRLARTICWIPAVKNGKHVRSIMKLDIQFRLDPSRR